MRNIAFRLAFLYVTVCCLLLIMGCVSNKIVLLNIPFQYKTLEPPNEGVHVPVIPLGEEKHTFSIALVHALQELEYSIISPIVSEGETLPEAQPIETDAVTLNVSNINAHNSSSATNPILSNAIYQLSYKLEYRVNSTSAFKKKRFSLKVWAKLERRGAGGDFHEYPRPYSGHFFANQLRDCIESELKKEGATL